MIVSPGQRSHAAGQQARARSASGPGCAQFANLDDGAAGSIAEAGRRGQAGKRRCEYTQGGVNSGGQFKPATNSNYLARLAHAARIERRAAERAQDAPVHHRLVDVRRDAPHAELVAALLDRADEGLVVELVEPDIKITESWP